MMRWWSRASIRVRLTAWYSGVLTLMLVVYAGATYVAVRHEFYEQLEQEEHVQTASVPADPHQRIERQLDEILVVLVLGLPLIVSLAGVGGYVLARRALSPIDRLAADARRITAERLDERLSVANEHDEIGQLAAVINEDERQQRLQVDAPAVIRVVVDRLVIRDAIANLIDNAIKYGPPASTIVVDVKSDATEAVLNVSDEGPGISAEHRGRIFDRFYRIDEGRSRDLGGTGLGLAIAKWAVEANGGQITLDSTECGSTFRIVLPRAP